MLLTCPLWSLLFRAVLQNGSVRIQRISDNYHCHYCRSQYILYCTCTFSTQQQRKSHVLLSLAVLLLNEILSRRSDVAFFHFHFVKKKMEYKSVTMYTACQARTKRLDKTKKLKLIQLNTSYMWTADDFV